MNRKKTISQLNRKINELAHDFSMFNMEYDTYDCDNPEILMKTDNVDSQIDRFREDCNSLKQISDDEDFKKKALNLQADIDCEVINLDDIEMELSNYAASLNVDEYAEIQHKNK